MLHSTVPTILNSHLTDIWYLGIFLLAASCISIHGIFFRLFQTLWLSRCGLHPVEDLNRDKPVCLGAAELRVDRMGTPIYSSQDGCPVDNLALESCALLRLSRAAKD